MLLRLLLLLAATGAAEDALEAPLPLSANGRAKCGDLVCTEGETSADCPQDCDPFRVAWRGCVSMLEPPSAGCLRMLPSAGTLRLSDLAGEKERSCAEFTENYLRVDAVKPPPARCSPPTDDGEVPAGLLLPDSGGVVLPPRPEGAPWGVKSVWRWGKAHANLVLCKACGTHPTETRAYSQDEAVLVRLNSGRVLFNPRAGVSDAALQRAAAVERRPGAPNILVVVLDGATECHARLGAPRLADMVEGRGEGLEGLGVFPLRNFHRLTEMTTFEHMTMVLGGARQVVHKHAAHTRQFRDALDSRWIWRFLRDQGYVTSHVGNRMGSRTYGKAWFDRQFDCLIAARTGAGAKTHGLCLGGRPEPAAHLQFMDELAAAVEGEAPVFGLVHEMHQHPPFASHAVVFETLVDTLPDILRRSNTVAVVMGDHGQQVAMRDWPLLSLLASEQTWAGLSRRLGRDVPAALRANADRLVGHYDVYETLRELGEARPGSRLRAPVAPAARRFLPWASTKARSLLSAVGDRTLLEVGVSPLLQLLARARHAPEKRDDARVVAAVATVVGEMNAAVAGASVACPRMELETVHAVTQSALDDVAAFKVRFSVTPGSFHYEALLLRLPGQERLQYVDFPTRVGDKTAFVAVPVSKYAVNERCAGGPRLARLCLCGVPPLSPP